MRAENWLQLGSTAAVVKIIDSYDVYLIVARKIAAAKDSLRLLVSYRPLARRFSRDALGKPKPRVL